MNFWHMIDSFFYVNKQTKKLIGKIAQSVFFIILITFIIFAGYFGYKQYIFKKEAVAQQSLAYVMTLFEDYSKSAQISQDLNIINEIKKAQEEHKNSSLASYFSILLSKVYAQEEKTSESLQALEDGIELAKDSLTENMLKTNYALLMLDSNDSELQKNGLATLKELIEDKENPIRDIAQFYLGKYFWINNDLQAAKIIWQEFLDEQAEHRMSPSPFVPEVELSLSSLI